MYHLSCFLIVKEVGPIRVCLHDPEDEQLFEAEVHDEAANVISGFQVQFNGSVDRDTFYELRREDLSSAQLI